MRTRNDERGIGEVIAAISAVGVVAAGITFTYAMTPLDELYNVSNEGLGGGLSRTLVFLNYSAALVAIPVAAIVSVRLGGRRAAIAGLTAVGLSAVVVWPGVVEQSDLDARPVNALPAAGVALAAALTVIAWRRFGGGFAPRRRLDPARVVLAVLLLLLAIPWLAAAVGGGSARVHSGHHHGFDGVLLALCALVLSRMRIPRLRLAVGAYLALMLAYGVANAVQDAWLEQVVKRGWTLREIPSLIIPEPSVGWAAVLLTAAGLFAVGATERAQSPR